MAADDIFREFPERQLEALSIRFGEGTQPTTYHEVAYRLGISDQAAHKLVRKGCRRLAKIGIDLSCLFGRAT